MVVMLVIMVVVGVVAVIMMIVMHRNASGQRYQGRDRDQSRDDHF